MSVFFVSTVKIRNEQKFRDYLAKAAESFKAHRGEPLLRGKLETVFTGAADFEAVGIVRFPDRQAADDWYHGDQYQALIPLRDEAVEMVLAVFSDLT